MGNMRIMEQRSKILALTAATLFSALFAFSGAAFAGTGPEKEPAKPAVVKCGKKAPPPLIGVTAPIVYADVELTGIPLLHGVDFRTTDVLGNGRFKEVYRGTLTQDGHAIPVAVINFFPAAAGTAMGCDMYKMVDEATLWALGSGTVGVQPLLGKVKVDGMYYLVSPLAHGDLDSLRGKVLPLQYIHSNVQRAFGALEQLHVKQMVHRDIKPGNILMDSTGLWNISDFGEGKRFADEHVGDGNATQSYKYPVAPRYTTHVEAVEYGKAADKWAMGLTALTVINNGEFPFPVVANPLDQELKMLELTEQDVERAVDRVLNAKWPDAAPEKAALRDLLVRGMHLPARR